MCAESDRILCTVAVNNVYFCCLRRRLHFRFYVGNIFTKSVFLKESLVRFLTIYGDQRRKYLAY